MKELEWGETVMKKYYVVWKGKKTGIYTSWDECKKQVSGVAGAKYKSFSTEAEAKKAFSTGWEPYYGQPKKATKVIKNFSSPAPKATTYIPNSISVDAACSGNPGPMEYKGVSTQTGEILFHFGPITGTNNIGEFLAIVHGLSYLKERNLDIPIYSDSKTAIKWIKMKKANTTLDLTEDTKQVWNLIKRAENWLANHSYSNKILKWETEIWGEVKADFGRK